MSDQDDWKRYRQPMPVGSNDLPLPRRRELERQRDINARLTHAREKGRAEGYAVGRADVLQRIANMPIQTVPHADGLGETCVFCGQAIRADDPRCDIIHEDDCLGLLAQSAIKDQS